MNKHLWTTWIGCIGICMSCSTSSPEIPEFDCQLLRSITEYPDSSFFKSPSQLYKEEGTFYAFDQTRGDVARWDCSTPDTTFQTVGTIGSGPEEVVMPKGYAIYHDTVFIADMGSLSLKAYYGGRFIRSIPSSWVSDHRFFIANGYAYLTDVTTDSACYAKIPLNLRERTDLTHIQRSGHLFALKEKDEFYNRSQNQRMLAKGGNYLYAASMCYPVIEKYDLATDKLTESYDLSAIPIVQEIIDRIQSEHLPSNAVYLYLKDIYWHKEKLYILCTYSYKGQNKINVIATLDTASPTMRPYCLYHLPKKYETIAIDDEHIYAAGPVTCTIDMYSRPQ